MQKTMTQREPYYSTQFVAPIVNTRIFYFLTGTFILLQAIVIQFNIESRMFLMFLFLTLIFLFFYCLNKPQIAIMCFVIYIPFSKYIVGNLGTGINFTNIFVFMILFSWFISHEYRTEKFLVPSPLNLPLTLFAIAGFTALAQGSFHLANVENENLIITFWRWFIPFFLFILTVNNVKDKQSIKTIIKLILITTTIVGLMTIKQYIDLGEFSSWEKARVASIAGNPNTLGTYFINFAPILLGIFALSGKSKKNWFLLIPYLICSRGLHVTLSRGAWLGYGVAAIIILVLSRTKKLIFLVFLLISLLVMNPSLIPENVKARFGMTFAGKKSYIEKPAEEKLEKSASDRLIIWGGALEMIKTHPFFGLGYGTFPYFIMDYCEIGEQRDAHNTYLRIAAEMGIPALLIFLSLMITAFYITFDVFRKAKDKFIKGAALGFCGSIVGLLASSMFGSRMNSLEIIGQFWIMVGLMQRMRMIIQKEKEQTESGENETKERDQDEKNRIYPLSISRNSRNLHSS